jgi:DNA polymerase
MDLVQQAARPIELDALRTAMRNCKCCEIACNGKCTKTLPVGNERACVLVIGDFPTESQWNSGQEVCSTFQGGKEWTDIVEKIFHVFHVDMDKLFFMNAISCFPHKVVGEKSIRRQPNSKEMAACKVYLDYVFKAIDPVMVILMGNFALNAFSKDVNIAKARGQWTEVRGVPAMPTYSPAQLVQLSSVKDPELMEEYKADFCDDIRQALLWIQDKYPEFEVLTEKLEDE